MQEGWNVDPSTEVFAAIFVAVLKAAVGGFENELGDAVRVGLAPASKLEAQEQPDDAGDDRRREARRALPCRAAARHRRGCSCPAPARLASGTAGPQLLMSIGAPFASIAPTESTELAAGGT